MTRPDDLFIPRKQYPEPPAVNGDLDTWARDQVEFQKKLLTQLRQNDLAVQDWANRQPGAAQTYGDVFNVPRSVETPIAPLTVRYDTNSMYAAPVVQNDTIVLPATGRWFFYMSGLFVNEGPDFTVAGSVSIKLKITVPTIGNDPEHQHFIDFNDSGTNSNTISLGYNLNCTAVGQTVTPTVTHTFDDAFDSYTFNMLEFSCFQLSLPPTPVQ